MTFFVQRTQFRLTAQYQDITQAQTVRDAINEALYNAAREVDKLFSKQNGTAEIADVSRIYDRYGFRNDSGWQQLVPLETDEKVVTWDIPEGMLIHEAEQLLTVLGAETITLESEKDDELLRQVPHPAALFLSELDDAIELDEEEILGVLVEEKKILH